MKRNLTHRCMHRDLLSSALPRHVFALARGILLLVVLTVHPAQAQARVWLWAWDRAEDVSWVPEGMGVAYFAAQFDAKGNAFAGAGRRAPLNVRADTPLMPVIHIEAFHRAAPASLDAAAVERWSSALAKAVTRFNSAKVQIDFEARESQREFYRQVLLATRAKLPSNQFLSITTLTSWCGDAKWLASLPVDEIVPMHFRMGPAERELWRRRMVSPNAMPQICRGAAGIATDEWAALIQQPAFSPSTSFLGREIYLFAPTAWRAQTLRAMPRWNEVYQGNRAARKDLSGEPAITSQPKIAARTIIDD
jgi:hypothetical protein